MKPSPFRSIDSTLGGLSSTDTESEMVVSALHDSGDRDGALKAATEILRTILARSTRSPISDIQIRTDRYIYIHTKHGPEAMMEWGRLSPVMVEAMLIVLFRAQTQTPPSIEEEEAFLEIVNREMEADLACEGGAAFAEEGIQVGRMRVRVFFCTTGLGITCRVLNDVIPPTEVLGFDHDHVVLLQALMLKRSGIALVTGPTGSGKSTTLASLLNHVKNTEPRHIVTIEDPVEYKYSDLDGDGKPAPGYFTQMEIGRNVRSFSHALKGSLRMAPQIILIGEIRDAETVKIALEAAQTGHLVIATLHTRSATRTVRRITEMLRAEERPSVLGQLADSLLFVLSQGLLVGAQQEKRVLCYELLLNNSQATTACIRDYNNSDTQLEESVAKGGGVGWDSNLQQLLNEGLINTNVFNENKLNQKRPER